MLFTSPWEHDYLPDIEARESGGTPPILQAIQAGLVFDLKQRIGVARISEIKRAYMTRAYSAWKANPRITILGQSPGKGLGVLSIVVEGAHHSLITALLLIVYAVWAIKRSSKEIQEVGDQEQKP